MADLREIADKTVEYNNSGRTGELLETYYDADAISAEAQAMGEGGAEVSGLDAIRGKHAWWESAHEIHSTSAQGPFLHGENRFGVIYEMDVTNKESGERVQMRELAIYTVEGGKVVREEFFY